MNIETPDYRILSIPDRHEAINLIEMAGRVCYKSEYKEEGAPFISRLIDKGHLSVIEHAKISVIIFCDRGVSHELVRHRLASYSQESTRWGNYSLGRFGHNITVIKPLFWDEESIEYAYWHKAMRNAEESYMILLEQGASAQEARSVLPNSLKTEIVMSANIREWRHVFSLRCAKQSHPQMREVMRPLLSTFHHHFDSVLHDEGDPFFGDLASKFLNE